MSARVLGWSFATQLVLSVASGEKGLHVTVTQIPGSIEWVGVAIEGSRDASVAELLESHGHRDLGRFRGMHAAIRAAEQFAAQWQRGKPIEACACGEIGETTGGAT